MGQICSSGTDEEAVAQGSRSQAREEAQDAAALLGQARGLASQVDISISAHGIKNLDTFSKSDPMAVLLSQCASGQWLEIGRTEVVSNSTEPRFVKQLRTLYAFEDRQLMKVQLWDVDTQISTNVSHKVDLARQDFVGEAAFFLSELITAQGQRLTRPVSNLQRPERAKGSITARAEEVTGSNANVTLRLRAESVDKKDTFGSADPFVIISRIDEDGNESPVFKSEVQHNTLHPAWAPMHVTLQHLCNADLERPLSVRVLDWDRGGGHDLIGEATTSLRDLQARAASTSRLPLRNSKKAARKPGYGDSGKLVVDEASVTPRPSFLEYIRGGMEISFLVALDFTASNGNPNDPASLHYISPDSRLNPYQAAIVSVGEVLEFYDSDKQFPAWGFGGKLGTQPVSHCFALNGRDHQPADGVGGILAAYSAAIQSVALAGPTLFTPVIHTACEFASRALPAADSQAYYVLLIITDGVINDMDSTIGAIVHAAQLPLSILIVGVGAADFSAMEALDGDERRLVHNGVPAARDIVQFVPLSKLQGQHQPGGHGPPAGVGTGFSQQLATELLAELPQQVVGYMTSNKIPPKPPRYATLDSTKPILPPAMDPLAPSAPSAPSL